MTQTHRPTRRPEPTRWRGWYPAAWFALGALVVAYGLGVAVLTLLEAWGSSTTCGDDPTAAMVREGRLAMLLLLGIAGLPWVVAAVFVHPRLRMVVAGLLAVSPALLGLLAALDPEFWRGSWCF